MMEIMELVLTFLGVITVILSIFSLFVKEKFYAENVKIIDNPSKKELDECKVYHIHDDIEKQRIEKTLFVPINVEVKQLKVYSLKLTKKVIKKDRVLLKIRNIEPLQGHLFYISRRCAMPLYLIEWITDYGIKSECILYQNGFNGNNNVKVVKYSIGIICKIRKSLGIR